MPSDEERRPKPGQQAFAQMEQAGGEPQRQRHVMSVDHVLDFEIDVLVPALEAPDCRQHDEQERSQSRRRRHGRGPQRLSRRTRRRHENDGDDGEKQEQKADIFRAGGEPGEEAEQDGPMRRRVLQQPDQRGKGEHKKGREENVLLEDAGMHGDEWAWRRRPPPPPRPGGREAPASPDRRCQTRGRRRPTGSRRARDAPRSRSVPQPRANAAPCARSIMTSG